VSERFDRRLGLIIVSVELHGPIGRVVLRLALDTGATCSMINVGMLMAAGYDPRLSGKQTEITTGSGVETVSVVTIQRLRGIGRERRKFCVLAHTLPSGAGVDGLLGLDFFRDRLLEIDFRRGLVSLG
jgi:predicted aspartyl protease